MKMILRIALIYLLLFFASCTQDISGGSSDHGNATTTIAFVDDLGDTIRDGTIEVLPQNHNPYKPADNAFTYSSKLDPTGITCIKSMELDSYVVIVFSKDSLKSAVSNISVFEDDSFAITLTNSGSMELPLNNQLWDTNGHYYIDELKLKLDSLLIPTWSNSIRVPEGSYSIKNINPDSNTGTTLFEDIVVISGLSTNMSIFPEKPNGPDTITVGNQENYYSYFDYEEIMPWLAAELIQFQFDWGDGTHSPWANSLHASHSWKNTGIYSIKVHMKYSGNIDKTEMFLSHWSTLHTITVISD